MESTAQLISQLRTAAPYCWAASRAEVAASLAAWHTLITATAAANKEKIFMPHMLSYPIVAVQAGMVY
jgi:hypothetical protein